MTCRFQSGLPEVYVQALNSLGRKYAASRRAAHLLSEGDVLHKEIQCVDDLALGGRRADNIAEENLCVLGVQHRVRRPPDRDVGPKPEHHECENADDDDEDATL